MTDQTECEMDIVRRASYDLETFQILYERYFDRISLYVSRRINNPHDAEDIVSTIFLLAMQRLHQFENNNKYSFAAWIFAIARNIIIDFYRRQGRLPTQVSFEDYHEQSTYNINLDEELIKRELIIDLRSLLQTLPERRREIIILRYINGLRNIEIARLLYIDERSISAHLSRGLKDLHEAYFADYLHDI